MSSEDLERVIAAAHADDRAVGDPLRVPAFPTSELQAAVASAISNGEPLTAVAAAAGLAPLAVLDAMEAHA